MPKNIKQDLHLSKIKVNEKEPVESLHKILNRNYVRNDRKVFCIIYKLLRY